eukprot:scaffold2268_cov349-Prasinococcus_capsulatus_cf.AAC.4
MRRLPASCGGEVGSRRQQPGVRLPGGTARLLIIYPRAGRTHHVRIALLPESDAGAVAAAIVARARWRCLVRGAAEGPSSRATREEGQTGGGGGGGDGRPRADAARCAAGASRGAVRAACVGAPGSHTLHGWLYPQWQAKKRASSQITKHMLLFAIRGIVSMYLCSCTTTVHAAPAGPAPGRCARTVADRPRGEGGLGVRTGPRGSG